MSNLWLNIRFMKWHITSEFGSLRLRIRKNSYHSEENYPHGYFSVYTFSPLNWR